MGRRRKVAILGGGMAALSAAYRLTSEPGWRDRYDVTVYQQGWMLGGKGASGRNRAAHDRIEEHGLHIFMGFYHRAFELMRDCYGELDRAPDAPLATWTQAFHKHSLVVFEERLRSRTQQWRMEFPENAELPGEGAPLPRWSTLVRMALTSLARHTREQLGAGPWGSSALRARLGRIGAALDPLLGGLELALASSTVVAGLAAHKLAHDDSLATLLARAKPLLRAVRGLGRLLERELEDHDQARRAWVLADYLITTLTGLVRDDLLDDEPDFSAIEHLDYREWLRKHGGSRLMLESSLVQVVYDMAYLHDRADAATAVQGTLRLLFGYKGAIFWKMQAGMGETVFAPLYQVLRARGVHFRFFHRVKHLALSPDRRRVTGIEVARQATPVAGEYQPLVDVDGLPCWPSEPLYEQLREGDAWRARATRPDLPWPAWPEVETLHLREGRDFDQVVLGIPVAALPPICSELLDADPRWRAMVSGIKTVRTAGVQLWLRHDARSLGWNPDGCLFGNHAKPHDTYADMTHLLARERWDGQARHLIYYTSALHPPTGLEDEDDASFCARMGSETLRFVETHLPNLYPGARGQDGGLDWTVLAGNGEGAARLAEQYVRFNVEPSERYVLSMPGTAKFRLRPGDSGFANLVLAGDWTRSGLNAGCIESATISGREAAEALAHAVARTEEHLHVDREAARTVPAVAEADAAVAARKAS